MKRILGLGFLIFHLLFSSSLVLATNPEGKNLQEQEIEFKKLTKEAKILRAYLLKFNSPLQDHAQDFINAADAYRLDWKLLPAIAGVESTFGKRIPGGYNAWGWGVYGTQAIYFSSWKDGIYTVGKGLRENYLNKGLNDPYSINKVYAASSHWGTSVTYFMKDIEKFAEDYEDPKEQSQKIESIVKIAAVSGQLETR